MRVVRAASPVPESLTIDGADYDAGLADYNPATTYALGEKAFVTVAGYFVNIYESLQNSNTGHDPIPSPDWWVYAGASNPFRMLDLVAGSQTVTNGTSITVTSIPIELVNTVAVLNITDGEQVTVSVVVDGDTVYSETQSLIIPGDGVTDWYEYFFGDYGRRTNALFTDLPSYAGQEITLHIEGGTSLAVGTYVAGYGYFLGETQYGARIGITDYSRKQANAFGGYEVLERSFAKKGSFTFRFERSRTDEIANLLPQYRATAVIWIGGDEFGATYIYGFYKDWGIEIAYPSHSIATIEIEGLA